MSVLVLFQFLEYFKKCKNVSSFESCAFIIFFSYYIIFLFFSKLPYCLVVSRLSIFHLFQFCLICMSIDSLYSTWGRVFFKFLSWVRNFFPYKMWLRVIYLSITFSLIVHDEYLVVYPVGLFPRELLLPSVRVGIK